MAPGFGSKGAPRRAGPEEARRDGAHRLDPDIAQFGSQARHALPLRPELAAALDVHRSLPARVTADSSTRQPLHGPVAVLLCCTPTVADLRHERPSHGGKRPGPQGRKARAPAAARQ
jgi:hypothetical protein